MTIFDSLVFLDKAEDWHKIVNTSKFAQLQGEHSHVPIPSFDLGIALQYQFIVVLITADYRRSTWSYGGEIRQAFNSAITGDVQYIRNRLRIDIPQLIELKTIVPGNFGLVYFPPKWFKDVTIQVWEYIGEVLNFGAEALFNVEAAVTNSNSNNVDLTEIIKRLDFLEDKINLLL